MLPSSWLLRYYTAGCYYYVPTADMLLLLLPLLQLLLLLLYINTDKTYSTAIHQAPSWMDGEGWRCVKRHDTSTCLLPQLEAGSFQNLKSLR